MVPMTEIHPLERWRKRELVFCSLFLASAIGTIAYGARGETQSPWLFAALLILTAVLLVTFLVVVRRVNAHIALEVEHARYTAGEEFVSLYDRSPVAYVTLAPNGSITRYNAAAVKLLGTTTDAITTLNLFNLVTTVDGTDPSVLLGKLRGGVVLRDVEVALAVSDSKTIWTLLSSATETHGGEQLVSLVDITEAKKVDTAKSEFVALATHQLRTPIAAIRWNTELLANTLKSSATEKQAKYLEKISRNVERMITLINDFLQVSKLEMGTFAAEVVSINLTEYLDAIVDEFAERFQNKQLTLKRTEQVAGLVLKTDTRLFHVILSNLLSNASKYATDNGTIWIATTATDAQVEITIADNGIGIPADEVNKLFTKFYRASNAVAKQAEGTGLGLYIVKQAVEQLGGTISVKAEADKGATFVVRLPLKK